MKTNKRQLAPTGYLIAFEMDAQSTMEGGKHEKYAYVKLTQTRLPWADITLDGHSLTTKEKATVFKNRIEAELQISSLGIKRSTVVPFSH